MTVGTIEPCAEAAVVTNSMPAKQQRRKIDVIGKAQTPMRARLCADSRQLTMLGLYIAFSTFWKRQTARIRSTPSKYGFLLSRMLVK
jgi:hypothetical protein